MFKRILIPLDGSLRAERALPIAARIARASEGTIYLLRVTDLKIGYGPYFALPSPYLERARKTELASAKQYLAHVAQTEELAGLKVKTEAIAGTPAETIHLYEHESQADLVVMCSRGYTGFKRWASGSVTHNVARCSKVPVLVLREVSRQAIDKYVEQHPWRALVALDGTPLAETALIPALQLITAMASPLGRAELHLIRVVSLPPRADEEREQALMRREQVVAAASSYLTAITTRLKNEPLNRLGVEISWSVAEQKDVAQTLIREAELGENNVTFEEYDLIAMATHGSSGWQRLVHGSVTERILDGTKLPLLIVAPGEKNVPTVTAQQRLAQPVKR